LDQVKNSDPKEKKEALDLIAKKKAQLMAIINPPQ
jgi:hypothetical protein